MFRSGMPREAAGPVAETTTPTFRAPWARAANAKNVTNANARFILTLLFSAPGLPGLDQTNGRSVRLPG